MDARPSTDQSTVRLVRPPLEATHSQRPVTDPNEHPLLTDKSQDFLCTHDLNGKILSINAAPARALGYSVKEMQERSIQDFLIPEYQALFDQYLRTIKKQRTTSGLMKLRTRAGKIRTWEYHNVLRGEGEETVIFAIAHDVTEARRAERSLRQLSEVNRAIVDSTVEGIILVDRELRLAMWNPYMEKATGIPENEVIGRNLLEIFPALERQRAYGQLQDALQGTSVEGVDICLTPADGLDSGTKWFSTTISPLRNSRGMISWVVATLHDVTERKLAEDRLRESHRFTSLLWTVAHVINEGRSLDDVLHSAVNGIAENLGCDVVLCFLVRDGALPLAAISRTTADFRDVPVHQLGECLCGLAMREQAPQYSSDICNDPRCTWKECCSAGMHSFAALPLTCGAESVGVLGLGSAVLRDFCKDSRLLETLAGEVSLVLRNAILLQEASTRASDLEREISDRKRIERALRQSELQLRSLVDSAPYAITRASIRGDRFLEVNPAAVAMLGYGSAAELLDVKLSSLYVDPNGRAAFLSQLTRGGVTFQGIELHWRRKDGRLLNVRGSARLTCDEFGNEDVIEGIFEDVTDQRLLQEQFFQAQKMEAVGRLAAGVAHDFNNLLNVIMGYAEMLQEVQETPTSRKRVEEIASAARRAAGLTRQLLAFSRKQVLQVHVLNLNSVLADAERMLRRIIGEDISFRLELSPDLWLIRADHTQIAQVLMNLAVNARDAMPKGGELSVTTANITVGEDSAPRRHGLPAPGEYVMLAVSDTGIGMDAAIQAQIFDPFFTTKPVGIGTGLGLATVYGIVNQSGGFILVESEVGRGTRFEIYLPRVEGVAQSVGVAKAPAQIRGGTETILVAEDAASLRLFLVEVLTKLGYRVLAAGDGAEALRLAEHEGGPIDLLLTDVILPNTNGPDLASRLQAQRPGIPVIYMSGYTDGRLGNSPEFNSQLFLQKPFQVEDLAGKVRSVLENAKQEGGASPELRSLHPR